MIEGFIKYFGKIHTFGLHFQIMRTPGKWKHVFNVVDTKQTLYKPLKSYSKTGRWYIALSAKNFQLK